jgi:hypothetical protein
MNIQSLTSLSIAFLCSLSSALAFRAIEPALATTSSCNRSLKAAQASLPPDTMFDVGDFGAEETRDQQSQNRTQRLSIGFQVDRASSSSWMKKRSFQLQLANKVIKNCSNIAKVSFEIPEMDSPTYRPMHYGFIDGKVQRFKCVYNVETPVRWGQYHCT